MGMSLGCRKAEINVTPLIDVLLVLIIIFMVVVPQRSVGLPAAVPQPAADASPQLADIVVSVNKDRAVTINTEPIQLERLQERLQAIFAARAN
jgi:biopolymer transport protein TolR